MKRASLWLLLAATLLCCLGREPLVGQTPPTGHASDEIQDVVFLGSPRPLLIRFHVHIDGKPFRAAWNELVDRVWKHLDKDGDGLLSPAELQAMPPASLLFGGNGSPSSELVRQFLKGNPTQKLTRDQAVKLFFASQGGTPFQFQGARDNGLTLALRAELDLAAARLGSAANVRGDTVNDALFRALDTDQDGRLSANPRPGRSGSARWIATATVTSRVVSSSAATRSSAASTPTATASSAAKKRNASTLRCETSADISARAKPIATARDL